MKTRVKNWSRLLVVLVSIGSVLMGQAQTFTTLHNFSFGNDGANPLGGLTLLGNRLYGTTHYRGSLGAGTVFAINCDGTGFTVLHSFDSGGDSDVGPVGSLVLSGSSLYGMTFGGGSSGMGSLFKLNIDGTSFTVLYSFTPLNNYSNSDGAHPLSVILSADTLYGTTKMGGSLGGGTVFSVGADGTGFTTLHSFIGGSDATFMSAGVILLSNTLYGTTQYGPGRSGSGSVFAVSTNGTGFTNIHNFTPISGTHSNLDGANPIAALITSGDTLYGTTIYGGTGSWGTVFGVNGDGTGFTNLHSFTGSNANNPGAAGASSDGTATAAALLLRGNTLYGTAWIGGNSGNGTVFCVNVDGTGFTRLHNFSATSVSVGPYSIGTNVDGANPQTGLIVSGNTLYGTTYSGGSYGNGTIFGISFLPQLTITPASDNLVLSWPTNYAGFDYSAFTLQTTTNLASPVWTTNSPASVIINGQYTVTNPISGTQQFFRLSQ